MLSETELLMLVLPLAVLAVLAVRALTSERQVLLFADVYGLELTDRLRPVIEADIKRSRIFRVVGGAVGVLAAAPWANPLLGAGVGFVAGAAVAELTRRPTSPQRRTALLTPRRLREYVRPWLVGLEATLTVAVPLAYVATRLVPAPEPPYAVDDLRAAMPTVVTLYVCAIGLRLARRVVVHHALPASDDVELRADDALRRASVVALTLVAVSFLLIGGAVLVNYLAQAVDGTVSSVLAWVGFLGGLAGVIAYVSAFSTLPRLSWRTTRSLRAQVVG